jgi:hypothetical protein
MKSLEMLKKNCIDLMEKYDTNKHDRMITYTEWKNYAGSSSEEEWSEFKKKFITEQRKTGFIWKAVQGYAGPIELKSVELNSEIGTSLAKLSYNDGITEGHFINDILRRYIPEIFHYLGEEFFISNVSYSDAKDEFKSTNIDGKVYKCSGYAGVSFKLSTSEYRYSSGANDRKKEFNFGELIIKSPVGKSFFSSLGLTHIEHVQESRKSGKYQNVDFQGFQIKRTIDEDFFIMYNFELKPSNDISQISTAISQAINYKEKANHTFIVIPNFDYDSFYDPERFSNFHDLCKKNQIGIISIRMNIGTDEIEDIFEVLPAEKTEITDYTDIKKMVDEQGYEKCVICRRIVKSDEKREGCGWRIVYKDKEGKERQGCMKEQWGHVVIGSLEKGD